MKRSGCNPGTGAAEPKEGKQQVVQQLKTGDKQGEAEAAMIN